MKQTSDVSFSHAIGIQNLLDDLLDYDNNSKCISLTIWISLSDWDIQIQIDQNQLLGQRNKIKSSFFQQSQGQSQCEIKSSLLLY